MPTPNIMPTPSSIATARSKSSASHVRDGESSHEEPHGEASQRTTPARDLSFGGHVPGADHGHEVMPVIQLPSVSRASGSTASEPSAGMPGRLVTS